MEWIRERPIAHRGLHSESIPENSLNSFRAAIEKEYAVEFDVRLTADGVPVVYHDSNLSRLTDCDERVCDCDWSDVSDVRIDGTEETIPGLERALEVINGETPILIELKNSGKPGPLEKAVIDRLDSYDGEFALQAFNPLSVSVIRKKRPSWPRGQLSFFYEGEDSLPRFQRALLKRLLLNWYSRPDFIAYDHTRLPYWPVTVHRKLGLPVLGWTVRSEGEFDRVEPYVDNVIFEEVRP